MTAPPGPVGTDNVIAGAVKWLRGFPDVTAALGATAAGNPYLFQHTMWVTLEGTGSTAAVLSRAGSWAARNTHNTMRFPRLALEIWADPIRDGGLNATDPGEVQRRADAAFTALDAHLHRPADTVVWWGSVRTLGCQGAGDPVAYPVPDGTGMVRLLAYYNVTQG